MPPGAGLTLPLGQPVKVQVSLKATVRGLPLPMAALTRNTANQVVVWVKTAPERFESRAVQTQPLDGVRVAGHRRPEGRRAGRWCRAPA
jgi:cobalt-zinc-cadmium efflux system membrane fusion protein